MIPGYTATDHLALLPAILLALFGCAVLLLDVFAQRSAQYRKWLAVFSSAGLAFTAHAYYRQWRVLQDGQNPIVACQGAVVLDPLGLVINTLVLFASFLLFASAYRFLEIEREHTGEFYSLALFAQCGMYFMAVGHDLVSIFLGLELTAICFYILVGFTRSDRRSNEAALKYLLLGALSSGFILYGFSLLYGISGSTDLAAIQTAATNKGPFDPFLLVATVTISIGLLFKISAAPFHMWAPDAYDGAPTPVTAYLSVASKIASFAVVIRLLTEILSPVRDIWNPILIAAAVLSLTIGSLAALTQDRLKRLLAYSSIAHAGYVLLGLITNTVNGNRGVLIYLAVYALMNIGTFLVIIALRRNGIFGEHLFDLRGLSSSHPAHAALLTILLLSLAGMPPTAGFIAKYYIFLALIDTAHYSLAALAAVYVAVSLYFYFRLVREMYLQAPETREPLASSYGLRLSLVLTSALTILVGIYPEPFVRLIEFGLAGAGR